MTVKKVHLAALALLAGVLALPSTVTAEGWFSRMDEVKEVTLTELLKSPQDYVDVSVEFKVYFNAVGSSYNPYYTRFTEEMYGNFSGWPLDARLYEKRDFQRCYHFFFVQRRSKTWKKLQKIDRLQVVELTGTVREIFKGQPWIEITDFSTSREGLSEQDLRDVIAGDAYFLAGKYRQAANAYDAAVDARVPDAVKADLYRKLADAHYQAANYRRARDSYRDALRAAPDSEVLVRGANAADTALAREYAERRGKPLPEEVPGPAPAAEEVVQDYANGVDEIIRLLEDPAAVEAEVEGWRLELEKRAAAVREAAGTTAVSGEEETEAPAGDEDVEEAEEGCGDAEGVVGEGTAVRGPIETGCAPEAPETAIEEAGCGETPEETPWEVGDGCGCADEGCGCAETPAEGCGCGETPEEGCADEAAEGCAETAFEDDAAETPAEGCGCAETMLEDDMPETPAEGCGCAELVLEGDDAETPAEGCGCAELVLEGDDAETPAEGCGEGDSGVPVVIMADDACSAEPADPHVVQVGDVRVTVPRLPFFGCEYVTHDELRAVVEEILRNPEHE